MQAVIPMSLINQYNTCKVKSSIRYYSYASYSILGNNYGYDTKNTYEPVSETLIQPSNGIINITRRNFTTVPTSSGKNITYAIFYIYLSDKKSSYSYVDNNLYFEEKMTFNVIEKNKTMNLLENFKVQIEWDNIFSLFENHTCDYYVGFENNDGNSYILIEDNNTNRYPIEYPRPLSYPIDFSVINGENDIFVTYMKDNYSLKNIDANKPNGSSSLSNKFYSTHVYSPTVKYGTSLTVGSRLNLTFLQK